MPDHKGKVIIADDEGLVRAALTDMLTALGYEVVAAVECGEDAVMETRRLHPDVVLMDISMPGIGGTEAARLIRDLPEPAPVVFLTALRDEEVAQEAADSGGFGYLTKPFQMYQLVPLLQVAIKRFRDWQQERSTRDRAHSGEEIVSQFAERLRGAGLATATAELLEAVGSKVDTWGMALCLLDPDLPEPSLPAQWGEAIPERAMVWVVSAASCQQPCETVTELYYGEPGAIVSAPLEGPGEASGALVAFHKPERTFEPEERELLRLVARKIGQSLLAQRERSPAAWHRWVQAGRCGWEGEPSWR